MATLETHGLTKSYGKTRGIEDVTLEIGDGEFFVILGSSLVSTSSSAWVRVSTIAR